MKINHKYLLAVKRKRGELNIPIIELARQIGISRYTLDRLFKDENTNLTTTTVTKIKDWLLNQNISEC